MPQKTPRSPKAQEWWHSNVVQVRHQPTAEVDIHSLSYKPVSGNKKVCITLWKCNVDTKNYGLEDVSPFKYGHVWYLCEISGG